MSSITAADTQYLEKILDMGSGYVLNFTNSTFTQFFRRYGVDIDGTHYQHYGASKAKRMRAFWEVDPDAIVGIVLSGLLDVYEAQRDSEGSESDAPSLKRCREISDRLLGKNPKGVPTTEKGFLEQDFDIPSIEKLPIEATVAPIIQARLKEAQVCLSYGAHLSVIFQCGSVLEAVLLGAAQREPEKFNRSSASPKRDGKVKAFHEWHLSEFIDVAHSVGILKLDIMKFSHGLRDFRNYIHPYQQMISGFSPDEHTATVCIQVLKAALADVAGER